MGLENLKNLSPLFNNDKIISFQKPLIEDAVDFTPNTRNDEIKPFQKLLIKDAVDFTPKSENDVIVIPQLPTGNVPSVPKLLNIPYDSTPQSVTIGLSRVGWFINFKALLLL